MLARQLAGGGRAARAVAVERRRIEHVIVHPHETGDNRVAMEIERLRARGDRRIGGANARDPPARDDDRLVLAGGSARAVDHADMCESHRRGIDPHEGADIGPELLGWQRDRERG